jgi:DNA-binding MarR family transcriptional regulator
MSTVDRESDLEQSVYRLLTRTFILLDDFDRQFFAEHGLSTRQFWALQHLDEQQGRSMIDLSRLLLTDKSNVTGIVDHLERLDYVVRTPDSRDRRVILVTLTPKGNTLRTAVAAEHIMRIRELMGVVETAHMHVLLMSLEDIGQSIETYLANRNST